MVKYAAETTVSSDRSRSEIELTLKRYGATAFGYLTEGNRAAILFQFNGKRYKVLMELPDPNDAEYKLTPERRRERTQVAWQEAYEQAVRQKWRALALKIKADLEADESDIISLEISLQPFAIMANGQTLGEWVQPQLTKMYQTHTTFSIQWEALPGSG